MLETKLVDGLIAVVGEANVSTDESSLRSIGTNTYGVERLPLAVVRPGSTGEVAAVVKWAGERGVSLYLSSRGMNLGYGSRVPPSENAVLLDLRRLNRILDLDPSLGYVRVEAGVSFGALQAHLAEHAPGVVLTAIGGSAESSLVGNLVERGLGKGTYGDRFLHACDLEVVLADGSIVRTGFGRYAAARAAGVHRWGLGPAVDGIFTQSTLGVVTQVTLWLQKKATYRASCVFWTDDDDGAAALVDRIRELKLEGTVTSTSLIANDVRRMSFLRQYPWAEMGGRTPLSRDVRVQLRTVGAWCGDFTLYAATRPILEGLRARARDMLAGAVDGVAFSDENEPLAPALRGSLDAVDKLAAGALLPTSLTPVYWRARTSPSECPDPLRAGAGLLWFAPAVPMRSEDASWCAKTTERIVSDHGFEPNMGFNCFSDRAFDCTTLVAFDRTIPGEDERARVCYRELVHTFAERGLFPYRMPLGFEDALDPYRGPGVSLRLKQALDPMGIFAGGRYVD